MKTIVSIIAIVAMVGILSCQKESDLIAELSPADELASEGMEEAYEAAKLYNDSLVWCDDTNHQCTAMFIDYCDSLFHAHDSSYNDHHANYSHNNVDDDHHHNANSQHHHGQVEHGEDEEEHHGHNQESHQAMIMLRDFHGLYHPN